MRKLIPINSDINRSGWLKNHTAGSNSMEVPLLNWPGKLQGVSSKEDALGVLSPKLAAYERALENTMEELHEIFLKSIFLFEGKNKNGEPVVTGIKMDSSNSRPRTVYELNQIAVYVDVVFKAYEGVLKIRHQLLNSSNRRHLNVRVWMCGRYKNSTLYTDLKKDSSQSSPYMGRTMEELLQMLDGTWSFDEMKVEDIHMGWGWGYLPPINPPTSVLPMFKTETFNKQVGEIIVDIDTPGDMRSFVEKAVETNDVFRGMHTQAANDRTNWANQSNANASQMYADFFYKVMKLVSKTKGSHSDAESQRLVDELEETFNQWEGQTR